MTVPHFLVTLAAVTGVVAMAGAAPTPDAAILYVVRPGETIWDIARSKLGDATFYTTIIEVNEIPSGAGFSIGRELQLTQ